MNGKVALQTVPKKEEMIQGPRKKVHIHHKKKEKGEVLTRFDLVADAAFQFFLVPFAIFVGFLAFFTGGFRAACIKSLEIIEEGKGNG
uniref:Uncharacterized protein n=1 Tax=viral metagenome TaxID=1070528 RepID=A0A6M3IW31_9ZZZZ